VESRWVASVYVVVVVQGRSCIESLEDFPVLELVPIQLLKMFYYYIDLKMLHSVAVHILLLARWMLGFYDKMH
jgi:hypothetical protein